MSAVRAHMIELYFRDESQMPKMATCTKDCYLPSHGDAADQHVRIARKQGVFHVLCFGGSISQEMAQAWVDCWITGHCITIDLRDYDARP
jgi:hypothetical protein